MSDGVSELSENDLLLSNFRDDLQTAAEGANITSQCGNTVVLASFEAREFRLGHLDERSHLKLRQVGSLSERAQIQFEGIPVGGSLDLSYLLSAEVSSLQIFPTGIHA
jgi:hypothetical protein